MAGLNYSSTTTTSMSNSLPQYIVDAKNLDIQNGDGETHYYFSEAQINWGYYLQVPEIYSAANALATWAVGRGIKVDNPEVKAELEHVSGLGSESFQSLLWNHLVTKKIVGDAFMEIVWNSSKNKVLNLIPIAPERVRLVIKNNRIKRYDVWNKEKWVPVQTDSMIHSMNNRIGDQIHGTSQLDACRGIINAKREALETMRILELRSRALGIAYYKTDKSGKISYVNREIEKAVKNGQMLGLPEETVKIEEFPQRDPNDRLPTVQYYDNFFYQVFGVPRSIASSDGTSEVGGKMGHVIFEPIYTREQVELEADFKKQAGIIFTLNRPPSLGGLVAEEEQKNTGQLNIQPNDVTANMNRE